jgi:hypothetical protein
MCPARKSRVSGSDAIPVTATGAGVRAFWWCDDLVGGTSTMLVAGLIAELTNTIMLAIPLARRCSQSRWIGYVLLASALMLVAPATASVTRSAKRSAAAGRT